jgi:DNA-binding NarL/FixJ family response regulator
MDELYYIIDSILNFVQSYKSENVSDQKNLNNNDLNHDGSTKNNINDILNKLNNFITEKRENDNNDNFLSKCFTYRISPSEKKVLENVLEGFLYKEISAKLNISFNTVVTHVTRIKKKCNAKNKEDLKRIFLDL